MKTYQVHLFDEEYLAPDFPPAEPVFLYGDKRYLNFLNLDCLHLKNSEYLKEAAKSNIEAVGIGTSDRQVELMYDLQAAMTEIKRLESLIFLPDEISAFTTLSSICSPQTNFFVDYETSPSIIAVLQHRNIKYYSHQNLDQLPSLLSNKDGKVIVIDGVYEWLGNIGPIHELIKIAKENECITIANEINSFGLLGREGRGFIDLLDIYDQINIEIGSFSRFLGGFGCYLGAKKYLISKIKENISNIIEPLPQFMMAVNLAALELIKQGKITKRMSEKLWKHSRYFITRLKQLGIKTSSETPLIVVSFNNNEEAETFKKKLFAEQIIVARNKERLRLCVSIEHSKHDLDYTLGKIETIGKELGIIT